MNSCMVSHATLGEQDAAREEWFAGLDGRERDREVQKRVRERQKVKHHEWWGLDGEGRRVRVGVGVEREDGAGGTKDGGL